MRMKIGRKQSMIDINWQEVDLDAGQVWVSPDSGLVYKIASLTAGSVYYRTDEDGWRNIFPTSRIQWELDVLNGRLLPGSLPNEQIPGRRGQDTM